MNNNFSREGAKARRGESIRHTRMPVPVQTGSGYPGFPKGIIQQAVGQWAGRFSSQLVQGPLALFPRVQHGGQS